MISATVRVLPRSSLIPPKNTTASMPPIPLGKNDFAFTTPANAHSMPLNTWTPTESGTSLPTILPTTKAPFHLGCPGADFAPTQKHTTHSITHNRLPLASTFHHYPPPPHQPMPPPANIIPQFWIGFFGSGKHALQRINAPTPDLDPPSSFTEYTYPTTSAKDDTELLSLETHLESASFEQASAGLPIRCDSSHRVLPTPGDAIPSNGLPPRPPPGQFRPRSPDRTTTLLATNQPANTPDSPESPRFLLRESPPDQPVAVEEAPVFEGGAG